ncbi:MAG: hypothetical protein NTY80_01465 [candidate division SR1 bacterium]|nr:hypothetical protein [candidate division SR1 bacterium]
MINKITHYYRKMPSISKLLLGAFLFCGIFMASMKLIHAENLPFENSLQTMFSGWFNSGYYSNTYFRFGGNNFVGIVFWQDIETLSTPQEITINNSAQAIECTGHLRGIYYNNQRGRRIWPLDTGNLSILSGQGSGYETMTMSNGLFTNCSTLSGGYTPNANDVYGQIDYLFGSERFRTIAGLAYDFTGNAISGALTTIAFDHNLRILTGGVHSGFIFDSNGGIAEVNMNVPWCQNFDSSPSTPPVIIPTHTDMTFSCYGSNVQGYILSVFLSGGFSPLYQTGAITTANSWTWMYGSGLSTGDYIATCTVQGVGGPGPQCGNNISFHVGGTGVVAPEGTGCNPDFQGEISFASASGSLVTNQSLGTYYTNRTGILMQLGVTEPAYFYVSGSYLENPFSGDYVGTGIFNFSILPISLIITNNWNYFGSTYTTGSCSYTDSAKRVYVDTLAPTTPTITLPTTTETNICSSLPLTVSRTAATDSGIGLLQYKYEIYNNSGMTTGLMMSGTVANTITSISINTPLLSLGTYYIRILAIDNFGMSGASSTLTFTTSNQYCASSTGIFIVTPTIWLRNVDLDRVYQSDPIYILGLTGPTLIDISRGMLFINNTTGGNGTTGIVTSSDTIYIEMISSNTYNTTVSSELHVLGLTGVFSLTTKLSNCILSAGEKLVIQNMYQTLKSQYNNDISKLAEFLTTFQSMVQDETSLSNSCTLEYLLTLIQADLGFEGGIDTNNHITPNCKEYSIGYDTAQQAYYAPNMINRYYFVNRESLIRHLDFYNPGDCHINTYTTSFRTNDISNPMKHIAPNGKIYHFVGQYGGYSATEFASPKYFDSLSSISMYVDLKNPAKDIWTHTVDTAFTPITYAAPNGKEYRIYKTDRGYMSYKLMKVRYYQTVTDIKKYIDANNPSRR